MAENKVSRRDFVRKAAAGTAVLGALGIVKTKKGHAEALAGKMKPEDLVKLLNQDMTGEIDAILTYMRNAFITDKCPPNFVMEEIGKDEMRHVEWLSELVTDFGGIPTMEHHELFFGGNTTEDFLKRSVQLEEGAIAQYKDHIEKIDHKEVIEVLEIILWEEEKHLKEFKELLQDLK